MFRVGLCIAAFSVFFFLFFCAPVFAEKTANIVSFELAPSALIKSPNSQNPTFESVKVTARKFSDAQLSGCSVRVSFTDLEGASVASDISKSLPVFSGTAGETAAIEFLSGEMPGGISGLADGQYIAIATLTCGTDVQASDSKHFSFSSLRQAIIPETNWLGIILVVAGILLVFKFAGKKKSRKFQ